MHVGANLSVLLSCSSIPRSGDCGVERKGISFGVKTATTTGGVSDGAQLKYTLIRLKALAEIVILPV
jgi:hypothetical protein